MQVSLFENINGVLAKNDLAWNPEFETAIIYKSENYQQITKLGCQRVYERTENYRALCIEFDNDLFDFIRSKNGIITNVDRDFDRVMKTEKLNNLLGKTRIISIDFQIKSKTYGKDCDRCIC